MLVGIRQGGEERDTDSLNDALCALSRSYTSLTDLSAKAVLAAPELYVRYSLSPISGSFSVKPFARRENLRKKKEKRSLSSHVASENNGQGLSDAFSASLPAGKRFCKKKNSWVLRSTLPVALLSALEDDSGNKAEAEVPRRRLGIPPVAHFSV